MTSILLDSLVATTRSVEQCFVGGHKEEEAVNFLESLYFQGVILVQKVVAGTLIGLSPLTPVVIGLDNLVARTEIHDNLKIQRSLSKTYRLFIELLWRQRLKMSDSVIHETVRAALIAHANMADELFQETKEYDIAFEYKTAKAAATVLTSPAPVWMKILEAPGGVSAGSFIPTCLALRKVWKENVTDSSYFDVHKFRWLALHAKTKSVFDSYLFPEYADTCHNNGNDEAINLVLICQDVLLNPQVQDSELIKPVVEQLQKIKGWASSAQNGGLLSRVREKVNPAYDKASALAQQFLEDHCDLIKEKLGVIPRKAVVHPSMIRAQNPAIQNSIEGILATFLLGQIKYSQGIYQQLIPLIVHFNEKQYQKLEPYLPRLLQATVDLTTEHGKLAQALAHWHYNIIGAKEHFIDSVHIGQQVIAAYAYAHVYAQAVATYAVKYDIHRIFSSLIFTLIDRHFIENHALKDHFLFAIEHEQPQKAQEVLDRLEKFHSFCSTEGDHAVLLTLYRQLRSPILVGESSSAFHPYLARINKHIETPFSQSAALFTQTYQSLWERFQGSFQTPHTSARELQREAALHYVEMVNYLLDNAMALIGPPPSCPYVILLGGAATREEVSRTSPLHLLFVVEEEYAKGYFELLKEVIRLFTSGGNTFFSPFNSLQNLKGLHLAEAEVVTLGRLAEKEAVCLPYFSHGKTLRTSEVQGSPPKWMVLTGEQKEKQLLSSFKKFVSHDSFSDPLSVLVQLIGALRTYKSIEKVHTLDVIHCLLQKGCIHADTHFLLTGAIVTLQTRELQRQVPEALPECESLITEEVIERLILNPLLFSIQSILSFTTSTDTSQGFSSPPSVLVNGLFSSCNLIEIALQERLSEFREHSILLEPFIELIASLPIDHMRYYSLLSKADFVEENPRRLYVEHVERKAPEAAAALLSIPTSQGMRQSTLRQEAELLDILRSFAAAEPTPVAILTHTNEKIYLRVDCIDTLIDPATGNIRRAYPESAHPVSSLVSAAGSLHFKHKPTQPLMEYAIHSLTSRIGGALTPATELVRFEVTLSGVTRSYPVLISRTITGRTLKTLTQPLDWSSFSLEAKKQWTWLLLTTILTKPGDGRSDNYILTPDDRVYCIDNDISFVEPYAEDTWSTQINFCSFLYLVLSNAHLDPDVLSAFSTLNVHAILDGWVEDVLKKEEMYLRLFKEAECETLYYEDSENLFTPALLLREGALSALGLQFVYLQNCIAEFLRKGVSITPLDSLKGIVSLRSNTTALNAVGLKIHEKYTKASRGALHRRLKTAINRDVKQSMKTLASSRACLGAIPTFEEIEAKQKFSLTKAREELLGLVLHQYPGLLSSGKNQGKIFIQGSFETLDPARQELVLKAYIHFTALSAAKPTTVIIQHCQALRTETLMPFLHEGLETLDISHSPHIKSEDIEMIQSLCGGLKELHIDYCPKIKKIVTSGWMSDSALLFRQLETFTLSHCPELVTLKIHAPLLKNLIARHNPHLITVECAHLSSKFDFEGSKAAFSSFVKVFYASLRDLSRLNMSLGRPAIAFGAAAWNVFFGDVGGEPALPPDIAQILACPCPIWANQRVRETHVLVLVPETVNGRPFCIDLLDELVQRPREGRASMQIDRGGSWGPALKEHGPEPAPASHWVLMPKRVLPGSSSKTYTEQVQYVAALSRRTGTSYKVAHLLDAMTGALLECVRSGNELFGDQIPGESARLLGHVQEQTSGYRLVLRTYSRSFGSDLTDSRLTVNHYLSDHTPASCNVAVIALRNL